MGAEVVALGGASRVEAREEDASFVLGAEMRAFLGFEGPAAASVERVRRAASRSGRVEDSPGAG